MCALAILSFSDMELFRIVSRLLAPPSLRPYVAFELRLNHNPNTNSYLSLDLYRTLGLEIVSHMLGGAEIADFQETNGDSSEVL